MRQPDLGLKFVIVIIATHGPPDRFFLIKRRRRPSGNLLHPLWGVGWVVCFSVYGESLQNQHVDYRGAFFFFSFLNQKLSILPYPLSPKQRNRKKGKKSDNGHC